MARSVCIKKPGPQPFCKFLFPVHTWDWVAGTTRQRESLHPWHKPGPYELCPNRERDLELTIWDFLGPLRIPLIPAHEKTPAHLYSLINHRRTTVKTINPGCLLSIPIHVVKEDSHLLPCQNCSHRNIAIENSWHGFTTFCFLGFMFFLLTTLDVLIA